MGTVHSKAAPSKPIAPTATDAPAGPTLTNKKTTSVQPPTDPRIKKTYDQVEATKGVMNQNVQNMLQNVDSATALQAKTDELAEQSRVFHEGTGKLKRRTKWTHRKITAVTVIIILLIIAVIVLAIVLPLTITGN